MELFTAGLIEVDPIEFDILEYELENEYVRKRVRERKIAADSADEAREKLMSFQSRRNKNSKRWLKHLYLIDSHGNRTSLL